MAAGAVALVGSVLTWISAPRDGDRAGRESLSLLIGLFAPSLFVAAAYFVRKADDASQETAEEEFFLAEEFM